MNMRRTALVASATGIAVGASIAPATSTAAEVEHVNEHGVVVFDDVFIPCVGPADLVTLDINQMYHLSANKNGAHERWVWTGTFVAEMEGGGTSAGRITFNDVADNSHGDGEYLVETDVWTGRVLSGVGAGTKWNWNQHFTGTTTDDGEWIIEEARSFFNHERCR